MLVLIQILKSILESIAAHQNPPGTVDGDKLADVYGTCMDESKLEEALPQLQTLAANPYVAANIPYCGAIPANASSVFSAKS